MVYSSGGNEVGTEGAPGEKGDGGEVGGWRCKFSSRDLGLEHESQQCKIKVVKLLTAGDIAQQSKVWSPVPSCLKAAEKQAPTTDWGRKKRTPLE